MDIGSATPLLLLEEVNGSRVLPIFIGQPEATAIAYALQEIEAPRPMSHDLMVSLVGALHGQVFSIEIESLVGNTYHAAVRLLGPDGEVTVSARPSDAIALALRSGAPIMVYDELMEAEGRFLDLDEDEDDEDAEFDAEGEDEETLVAELREFLDGFGKGTQ